MFSVQDKVVLVTGGTRGIGRGIALAFLQQGAQVFICGRNAPDAPVAAGEQEASFIQADVREPEDGQKLISEIVAAAGRLDVLINNAGGGPAADAATASPRFTEAIVRLNLLAPLLMSQLAYPELHRNRGSIINIASVSGVRSSPGTLAYGAAKAGLLNATLSLAQEWGPEIRVNAVVAGLIKTEAAMEHYGGEQGVARLEAKLPGKRMGKPEDIASACLYLASDDAEYVSGASLEVYG
ncbi:MAG: SDR family oxidoreductase, partial [Pseudomonadales bacterium]